MHRLCCAGRDHGLSKLKNLREAWVKYTCPAVAKVATEVLQKVCAGLTVPDKALDLTAFARMVELCKPSKGSQSPASPSTCPPVVMQTMTTPAGNPFKASRVANVVLPPADIRAMLPDKMQKCDQDTFVNSLQELARFLLHHGISDDVIKFVVSVHMLVHSNFKIDWSLWLHCQNVDGRPPLWWRVIMLILASAAPYYIQMASVSRSASNDFSSHYVDIMDTVEYRGQIPNLDIWTWDTAAVLQILQTHLFSKITIQAAIKVLKDCRNLLSHFNVDMSFGEAFDCIEKLLDSLGLTDACSQLREFRKSVSSWFPAFGDYAQMQQSRLRPLMLTNRQYDAFKTHVLDVNGCVKSRCRLRFQCAASSGKTVIATILAVEFFLDQSSRKDDLPDKVDKCVLFLTHAPILARRTANNVCDQLKIKLKTHAQPKTRKCTLEKVEVKRADSKEGCDVYGIFVRNKEVIVVATINAALKSLQDRVFLGGVVVDEAHSVYGSDRRHGQKIGQNILSAKEIAPIIERWGGARNAHEGANRLVLFGDERNQSMRRRFSDVGEDVVTCDGCGSQRLPNWINFTNCFYNRVRRLFDVLSVDELLLLLAKNKKEKRSEALKKKRKRRDKKKAKKSTRDITVAGLSRALENDLDIKALLQKPKKKKVKKPRDMIRDEVRGALGRRVFDMKGLCSFYHKSKQEVIAPENETKLTHHEKLLGTHEETPEEASAEDSKTETRKLCAHCALVVQAHRKGITCHQYFLGDIEDPVFPLEDDRVHPEKSMKYVARGFLDSNYRQPACIADVAASQHTGGGQKGALQIHHVDSDSVQGRATRYANVQLGVNIKKAVCRLLHQNAGTARKCMKKLTNAVCEAYVHALTKELLETTACIDEVKKSKKLSEQPDVLVLAPRCSDDPQFITRLKDGCLKQSARIKQLTKDGYIQFGTVGEWTGSDSPMVVLTGFHQPYHLLTNVGCFDRDDILAASVAEMERLVALRDLNSNAVEDSVFNNALDKYLLETEWIEPEQLEEQHSLLESRMVEIPVDTLLYIGVTRATWGLTVVEPLARRFAAHYKIGTEGRALSRAGKPFTAHWSDNSAATDGERPKSRVLHNAQVLLDEEIERNALNLSGKDLALIPRFVIDLDKTEILDLSVNKLQELPSGLWNLPLRTLDLSYNPRLGRVLLSIFKGAARCSSLKELRLRDVMGAGRMLDKEPTSNGNGE